MLHLKNGQAATSVISFDYRHPDTPARGYLSATQQNNICNDISPFALILLNAYFVFTGKMNPNLEDEAMATYLNWKPRSVRHHRLNLTKAGYFRKEKTRKGNMWRINYYLGKNSVQGESSLVHYD